MADTQWHAGRVDDGWVAARGLVSRLEERNPLPVISDPLDFDAEAFHVDVLVNASWYGPADVVYDEVEFLDFGGLAMLALTATASAIGKRRTREAAQSLAAPQWRAFGHAPVRALLTEDRLVLHADSASVELPFANGPTVVPDLAGRRLVLHPDGGPPYALHGMWVPYLAIALSYLLAGEVLHLDHVSAPAVSV